MCINTNQEIELNRLIFYIGSQYDIVPLCTIEFLIDLIYCVL